MKSNHLWPCIKVTLLKLNYSRYEILTRSPATRQRQRTSSPITIYCKKRLEAAVAANSVNLTKAAVKSNRTECSELTWSYLIAADANSRPKHAKAALDYIHVTHYTNSSRCEEDLVANVVCVDVFERRNAPNTSVVKRRCILLPSITSPHVRHTNATAAAAGTQFLISLLCVQCNALHGVEQITWVFVCLSVCLSVRPYVRYTHIVFDSDCSFCPIFLKFRIKVTHLTTKSKFDGQ